MHANVLAPTPDTPEVMDHITRVLCLCGKLGAEMKPQADPWRRDFPKAILLSTAVVLTAGLIMACDSTNGLLDLPQTIHKGTIPGIPGVRVWEDSPTEVILEIARDSIQKERSYLATKGHTGGLPPAHYLVLSGGGDKGAFGAGLLTGWTASRKRPEFKEVTGVSTGALMAPFAFLGSSYDSTLEELYTELSPKDVYSSRHPIMALYRESVANTKPFRELVRRYVDEKIFKAVAAEYEKGRLLFVGTTNLDARRAVAWNMGKIAASGHPESLRLFQDVLIASAALPPFFPPRMIEVEYQGRKYLQMHVDGGFSGQVFFYPPSYSLREVAHQAGFTREMILYIIQNTQLYPRGSVVKHRTISITDEAVGCLFRTAAMAELDRMYMLARRDGIVFNLAYIPTVVKCPEHGIFDSDFMHRLFGFTHELAAKGLPWVSRPPSFESPGKGRESAGAIDDNEEREEGAQVASP